MSLFHHEYVRFRNRYDLSRRSFLQYVSAGAVAAGTLNFRQLMSLQAAELRKQDRAMILLVDAGRAQPVRDLRSQAAHRKRRSDARPSPRPSPAFRSPTAGNRPPR